MSMRTALIVLTVAGLSGCASATEPMACEGNPKCKADTQPVVPTTLKLQLGQVSAPQTGAAAGYSRPR